MSVVFALLFNTQPSMPHAIGQARLIIPLIQISHRKEIVL